MQQVQQLVCLGGKRGIAGISVCQQHVQQQVCIVVSSGCCRPCAVQARQCGIIIELAEGLSSSASDVRTTTAVLAGARTGRSDL